MQVLAEDAVGDLDQQVPVPIPHITSTVPCTVYDQTIDVQPVNRPTDQNSEPVVNQLDKNIMCMYIYCDLYIYTYIYIHIYNYIQLYTIIYNYIQLYTIIYKYIQIYTIIYNYIQLYTIIYIQTYKHTYIQCLHSIKSLHGFLAIPGVFQQPHGLLRYGCSLWCGLKGLWTRSAVAAGCRYLPVQCSSGSDHYFCHINES